VKTPSLTPEQLEAMPDRVIERAPTRVGDKP
jgi:hypothetical protein